MATLKAEEKTTDVTQRDDAPGKNPNATLTGSSKRLYVRGMFARIAARYDLMNRVMSFGQDERWRREVARLALRNAECGMRNRRRPTGQRSTQHGMPSNYSSFHSAFRIPHSALPILALDVGAGTGLIAQELALRGARAVAVDYTPEMMLAGRDERGVGKSEEVHFVAGDALGLPFRDETFGCLTTGFMMRNVTDIGAAFREMRRVLKPGGRLVCLEVGRPRFAVARLFHRFYTSKVVPLLGRLIAGDADAYTYLPSSMGRFPSPPKLVRIMHEAGLRNVRYKQMSFGAVAVHWAER